MLSGRRLLSRGEAAAARIQSADAAAYSRALQLIEPTGDAIEIAAGRYAQAVNVLGNGQLIEAACRFYVERHPSTMPAITMGQAAGLEWKHNALRHSFVTYRVAATQDVNQTALEAGNSAKVVFAHYRALATKREGDAYFSIAPKKVKNILTLKTAAA